MPRQTHLEVLAVNALAVVSTVDAGLKTLAVLLQAARLLAVAAFIVASSTSCHPLLLRKSTFLKLDQDSFLNNAYIVNDNAYSDVRLYTQEQMNALCTAQRLSLVPWWQENPVSSIINGDTGILTAFATLRAQDSPVGEVSTVSFVFAILQGGQYMCYFAAFFAQPAGPALSVTGEALTATPIITEI